MDSLPFVCMLVACCNACYMDVVTDQRTADNPTKAIVLFRCKGETFLDQNGEKYPIPSQELNDFLYLGCWSSKHNVTLTLINLNHEELKLSTKDSIRLCSLGEKLGMPSHLGTSDPLPKR